MIQKKKYALFSMNTLNALFSTALILFFLSAASSHAADVEKCDLILSARLNAFTAIVRSQNVNTGIVWDSEVLRGATPVTRERAQFIITQLRDKTSVLSEELTKVHSDLKINGNQFWNKFLKAYDRVVPFCNGYLEIFQRAHQVLPMDGRIVDFGTGTGNGAALLLACSPDREVIGLDSSPDGLAIAKMKLAAIVAALSSAESSAHKFEVKFGDVAQSHLPPNSIDGAVMNNVLYSIADNKRLQTLKKIFDSLKSGAYLVLNDPRSLYQQDDPALGDFLVSVATSAAANRAPMTEYDFAFLSQINIQFLAGGSTTFLSPEQLKDLTERAGFVVESMEESYYRNGTLLVLKKP